MSAAERQNVDNYLYYKYFSTVLDADVSLPNTNVTIASGATLDLNGPLNTTLGSLADSGSGGTVNNSNVATPTTLILAATSGSASFNGTIQSGGANGVVNLTMSGTATQTFAALGSVTLNTLTATGGTLFINGNNSVNTVDFTAGTGVVNAVVPITITNQLKLANTVIQPLPVPLRSR